MSQELTISYSFIYRLLSVAVILASFDGLYMLVIFIDLSIDKI